MRLCIHTHILAYVETSTGFASTQPGATFQQMVFVPCFYSGRTHQLAPLIGAQQNQRQERTERTKLNVRGHEKDISRLK